MDIKVKNGNLALVNSGSLLIDGQPVTITMDGEYTIKFSFVEDSVNTEQKVGLETSDNGIEFILKNFNNPIGSAIAKPIEFAKKNGKPIYISFCVYAIGPSKLLHYNLFAEK